MASPIAQGVMAKALERHNCQQESALSPTQHTARIFFDAGIVHSIWNQNSTDLSCPSNLVVPQVTHPQPAQRHAQLRHCNKRDAWSRDSNQQQPFQEKYRAAEEQISFSLHSGWLRLKWTRPLREDTQ